MGTEEGDSMTKFGDAAKRVLEDNAELWQALADLDTSTTTTPVIELDYDALGVHQGTGPAGSYLEAEGCLGKWQPGDEKPEDAIRRIRDNDSTAGAKWIRERSTTDDDDWA